MTEKLKPEVQAVLDEFAREAEYKDWATLERSEFMWYPDTHERLATLALTRGHEKAKKDDMKLSNHEIGCKLEYTAQVLEFRGFEKLGEQLRYIASQIK